MLLRSVRGRPSKTELALPAKSLSNLRCFYPLRLALVIYFKVSGSQRLFEITCLYSFYNDTNPRSSLNRFGAETCLPSKYIDGALNITSVWFLHGPTVPSNEGSCAPNPKS